jgi:hypothetical protein
VVSHRASLVVVVTLLLASLARPASASHLDPKPNTTGTWYMNTVNGSILYDMGCNLANRIDNGNDPRNSLVVFAYGSPVQINSNTWGTDMPGLAGTAKTGQIRAGAEEYALGLWQCTTPAARDHLAVRLALGTTNDYPSAWGDTKIKNHGDAWATMVKNANDNIGQIGTSITIWGASDMELDWSSPARTRVWANGYDDGPGSFRYLNFGDAAGCQYFGVGDASSCGTSNFPGWDSSDVYYISFQVPVAWPLPQIYREDGRQAEQWVMISKWANDNRKPILNFIGPLSQHGACHSTSARLQQCNSLNIDNTPTQAWNQMVDKMDARPVTISDMTWSTDIDWR